jgi:RNA polymerase sigma-70 factor (ECF subfamily)
MANFGHKQGTARDSLKAMLPRLYKFSLILTANENLAKALLRAAYRAATSRKDKAWAGQEPYFQALKLMQQLWLAKLAAEPDIKKTCPSDPKIFTHPPVTGIAGAISAASLGKFIASLPSQQRAALYLVYGEGISYDEAAEILALNIPALMKLLARGHSALAYWIDHKGLMAAEVYSQPTNPSATTQQNVVLTGRAA